MTERLGRVCGLALALYFLVSGPVRLVATGALSPRLIVVYAVVAPLVGLLLFARHPRARFATYIFLSMDLLRTIRTHSWIFLAVDLAILLFLQTPLMRSVFPPIDSARVKARLRYLPNRLRGAAKAAPGDGKGQGT